jgi:mannobiose 2-epimerase
MWDKEFGGFYWEIDFRGKTIPKPHKRMYGQAFGLYALSEYASASADKSARALAQELFNLLEIFAHDQYYGGYKEFFLSDWSEPPEDARNYINNVGPFMKTFNTHLHLMEAIIRYYQLTGDPVARERLLELIHINSNAMVRKNVGACTSRYQRDWTPLGGLDNERVSYGHDLENVWLLSDGCNALGISNGPFLDLYRMLFVYTLTYGFDWRKGGFFYEGSYNTRADQREKIWWVQAEGLVSALKMYHLTGEGMYYDCFVRTLEWILNYQVDWQHGDWYEKIVKNGKTLGDKAGAWKTPYHNGRAMLECSELLLSLAESENDPI